MSGINPIELAKRLNIKGKDEDIYLFATLIELLDRAKESSWRADRVGQEIGMIKASQGKLSQRMANLVGVVGRHQKELFGGSERIDKQLAAPIKDDSKDSV